MSIYDFTTPAVPGQLITAAAWNAEFTKIGNALGNANLNALASAATGANRLTYWTGANTAGATDLTPFARTLLDDADAAAARATLGAAALASPALTGTPTAPTAAAGTSSTQLATTAFVAAGLGLKADLAAPTFQNEATIYGNANTGADGLTVSSFKPVLTLVDRSTSMASFRWAADSNYLRLEADNKDNGATWQAVGKVVIDEEGRIATGGGSASTSVGLYVRPTALLNTTGYGVYARPTFDPAVQTVAGRVFTALVESWSAGTLPRVDNYFSSAPAVSGTGLLTELNHFFCVGTSQATVDTLRGFYSDIDAVAGKTRWNAYLGGTAPSYIEGRLLLGTTTDNGVDALQVTGSVQTSVGYKVGTNQVVGARETGWTAAGGTVAANKGAWTPSTLAAASPTYVQAEHTATRTALNAAEARIKALEAAMRTHGLIN